MIAQYHIKFSQYSMAIGYSSKNESSRQAERLGTQVHSAPR